MKKIYMILAAITLLTMSLNAQQTVEVQVAKHQLSSVQLKDLGKLDAARHRFNDVVRGSIKGMAGILPEGTTPAQMRAPLRYDATQYFTVGPFEGDNFDYGYGFPSAYDANQDITIVTQLQSSEYEDHYGDSIVGFRLALYGDGNKMAKVDEFVVRPSTATTIYTADGYAWTLKDLTYVNPQGGDDEEPTPVATYDDIVIRPSSNAVNFTRIAVVSGGTTITEWAYPTNALPSTWTASTNFTVSTTYGAGYTSGTITIPGSLLTGYNNVQVVITAWGDNANTSITVGTQQSITTTSASYTWNIAASGSSSGGGTQTIEQYVKVTSTADLTSGDKYLIVYEGANRAFNGGLNSDQTNNYISVTITDNTIPANATTDAAAFTITSSGSYYTIRNANGYYIGRQANTNGITYSTSTAYNNTISISNGNATIQQVNYTRYLRYNTSDARFRYYGSNSANTQLPQLYKRVTQTVENPSSGSVDGNYVNLATGQWHEFYLNQPVEFQMRDDATSMMMGYKYLQYPSSNTTQELNPAAFNSQSTGHNHAVNLIQGSSSFDASGNIVISAPGGYNVMFYIINVYDGDTGNLLTSWNSSGTIGGTYNNNNYYALPTGWTLNNAAYLYQINLGADDDPIYFGYLSTSNSASITIANSQLQGATNVEVYIVAVGYEAGETIAVNGSSQDLEEMAFTQLEWNNIFNAPVAGWSLFNPSPAGDLAVQLILKSGKPTPNAPTVTSSDGATTTTITITPDSDTDGQLVYYVVDQNNQQTQNLTYPRGDQDYTVTVHAYTTETDNYQQSPEAVVTVTVPALPKTQSPVITGQVVGNNYVITATAVAPDTDASVTLTVGNQTQTGTGSVTITIPLTDVTQTVTATATAQATDKRVSDEASETFTIPFLQTAEPSISGQVDGDNYVITATGDGYVTLTVDGQTVGGNGSATITLPRHMEDYDVTVSAYAQETGKAASTTVTQTETVPGKNDQGWQLMTGTYSGHQSLSFVDSLTNKPIMFADSISALTYDNRHPDHYDYIIVEEGHDKTSNMVTIPVFKTYSTMYGLYTKNEVDEDTLRTLVANSPNVTMSYDINTDNVMYNYSLYRSKLNSSFDSVFTATSQPISKLTYEYARKLFSESQNVNTYNVMPTYTDISSCVVKRVDKYFTDPVGEPTDYENYVPVIWTMGSLTGRTDGKNNSYGSDIKRNTLGDVEFRVEVEKSDYAMVVNGETTYPGVWEYNNQSYTVFTPEIHITGTPPTIYYAQDGDTTVYEPYMYRAWCLYEGARDFVRDPVTQLLTDNGVITEWPILLDTHRKTEDLDTIGGYWTYGMDRLRWSFGAPVNTPESELTFAVRFYYKAIIKDTGRPLFRSVNRDGEEAEEYFVVEAEGNPDRIVTALNELFNGTRVPVSTTYVNALGMQSDQPFEGINIVVTRYSDGSVSTTKVIR